MNNKLIHLFKPKTITRLSLGALAIVVGLGTTGVSHAVESGIYGGGPFYQSGAAGRIDEIKKSGFGEVIVWNIFVNGNGDLNFNAEFPLCENGSYIGGATHPDFANHMAELKTGTVKRLTFGVGSWAHGVFQSIRDLINAEGTGPNSILYKNFQALKVAIPSIDAIDLDDENCFDQSTMTQFCVMLGNLGYKVSLCPYNNKNFWTTVASQVNNQRPGTIDLVHLQCYDGGAYNNPGTWNFGGIPVQPGLWSNYDNPSSMKSKITDWKNDYGTSGGWVWIYDSIIGNASSYAGAINDALLTVSLYEHSNFGGAAKALAPGRYTHNQLQAAGISNDWLSSARVPEGMSITLFDNDNFGGTSWTLNGDIPSFASLSPNANDKVSSCIVTLANATYKVLNRNSSLAVDSINGGTNNGNKLQQWVHSGWGGSNQHWNVSHIGNGQYRFIGQGSGRAIDVPSSSPDNSVQLQLWDWNNTGAQKWTLNYVGGGFFEAINVSSGKAMDVSSSSTANGAAIQQYTPNGTDAQKWIFLAP